MRGLVVSLVIGAGLTAVAATGRHDLTAAEHVVTALLLAAAVAALVSSARSVGALRSGAVRLDDGAPVWRPWRRALPVVGGAVALGGALMGAVVGGFTLVGPAPGEGGTLFWVASKLAFVGVGATAMGLAAAMTVPSVVRSSRVSRAAWLLRDAVLPSSLVAGCVGFIVGHVHFAPTATTSPGGVARALAGTLLVYPLIGVASFVRALVEQQSGAVVVEGGPGRALPGPVPVGLALAALVAMVGPAVLPALRGDELTVLKVVLGVVVGGGLSALGAWQGRRRALLGDT